MAVEIGWVFVRQMSDGTWLQPHDCPFVLSKKPTQEQIDKFNNRGYPYPMDWRVASVSIPSGEDEG